MASEDAETTYKDHIIALSLVVVVALPITIPSVIQMIRIPVPKNADVNARATNNAWQEEEEVEVEEEEGLLKNEPSKQQQHHSAGGRMER